MWKAPFALLLCSLAIVAQARNPDTPAEALEEVLVTAQKRTQSVQDVPISISVVTAKNIADINAFSFADLEQLTPGVTLNTGLQSASIRLRGVGPGFFAVNAPQSVVVFVDQFAQSQIGTVFSTLVDVERLELLRGPHGTLYGINAPGGAYNITTRAPDFHGVSGYIEGSYSQYDKSSDLNATDLRGAVNLPLVQDRLALRLAGVYRDDEGFIENVNPEASADSNGGSDTEAVRARLRWLVTDDLQLDVTGNYQDLRQYISSFAYEGQVPATGAGTGLPAQFTDFEDREDFGDWVGQVDGDVKDVSMHLAWDASFTGVDFLAMYQEFSNESNENRQPFPGSREPFVIGLDYEITTVELRFSDVVDDISYVTGLYYFERPADGLFNVVVTGVEVLGDSTGVDEGYAAFGNISYRFSEQWEVGLGARYDDIDTSLEGDIRFVDFIALTDDKLSFDHLSWSVKLSYYLNDNLTLYAAVDDAFKQGGFNPLVPGVYPLAEQFPDLFGDLGEFAEGVATYDEETSISYEVGAKGSLLDNRLRFSVGLFHQEFDDHQIGFPSDVIALGEVAGLFNNQIGNADEVQTQGVEFDLTYLLSDNWDLFLTGSYADPTIEKWDTRLCPAGEEPPLQPGQSPIPDQLYCPSDGDSLNGLPRWETNLQVGYRRALWQGWEFPSRLNWTWQSEPERQSLAVSEAPDAPDVSDFDEDKSRLDIWAGVQEHDLGLEIRLWAKNITDEDMNINPGRFQDTQTLVGSHHPGREYGVTARYSF